MSFEIITSEYAERMIKKLSKRYRSFDGDIKAFRESLKADPMQGVEIAPNIRKIRMAITSKGRGKSGGARVITLNALVADHGGTIFLLLVYDKADAASVKMNVVRDIIKDMGL